jgi:hypothetical protein
VSDLAESDEEINGGDREDNITLDSPSSNDEGDEDGDSKSSISLSGDKEDQFKDEEFNLNISFAGGYIPNTDLSRVDKG